MCCKGSAHDYAPTRGIAMQLIELSVQRLMTATLKDLNCWPHFELSLTVLAFYIILISY